MFVLALICPVLQIPLYEIWWVRRLTVYAGDFIKMTNDCTLKHNMTANVAIYWGQNAKSHPFRPSENQLQTYLCVASEKVCIDWENLPCSFMCSIFVTRLSVDISVILACVLSSANVAVSMCTCIWIEIFDSFRYVAVSPSSAYRRAVCSRCIVGSISGPTKVCSHCQCLLEKCVGVERGGNVVKYGIRRGDVKLTLGKRGSEKAIGAGKADLQPLVLALAWFGTGLLLPHVLLCNCRLRT